jgi:hypothetical protein
MRLLVLTLTLLSLAFAPAPFPKSQRLAVSGDVLRRCIGRLLELGVQWEVVGKGDEVRVQVEVRDPKDGARGTGSVPVVGERGLLQALRHAIRSSEGFIGVQQP